MLLRETVRLLGLGWLPMASYPTKVVLSCHRCEVYGGLVICCYRQESCCLEVTRIRDIFVHCVALHTRTHFQRCENSLQNQELHCLGPLYQRITQLSLLSKETENARRLSSAANIVLYHLSGLHFHGIFNKIILRYFCSLFLSLSLSLSLSLISLSFLFQSDIMESCNPSNYFHSTWIK